MCIRLRKPNNANPIFTFDPIEYEGIKLNITAGNLWNISNDRSISLLQ
ncbi:MAG: hypothetical protein IPJ43_06560 [Saprospiraceae bacterium]|nr:hypothetical protein [Saprospiraceae bacterium]